MIKLQQLSALLIKVREATDLTELEREALYEIISELIRNEAAKYIGEEVERQIVKPFEKLLGDFK